jgi:hypothetical protein
VKRNPNFQIKIHFSIGNMKWIKVVDYFKSIDYHKFRLMCVHLLITFCIFLAFVLLQNFEHELVCQATNIPLSLSLWTPSFYILWQWWAWEFVKRKQKMFPQILLFALQGLCDAQFLIMSFGQLKFLKNQIFLFIVSQHHINLEMFC